MRKVDPYLVVVNFNTDNYNRFRALGAFQTMSWESVIVVMLTDNLVKIFCPDFISSEDQFLS